MMLENCGKVDVFIYSMQWSAYSRYLIFHMALKGMSSSRKLLFTLDWQWRPYFCPPLPGLGKAATEVLRYSSFCFSVLGCDACCPLVLIRTNSSITEMSSSFKTKGEIFRKIFNFTVKGNKCYLFISIIRAKNKTYFRCVRAFCCHAYCLSEYPKINPWNSIHIPPITTAVSSRGKAGEWQTTTAGACALHSLGCNKNFTIFHKGVISDLNSKGVRMPTGAKFALAYVWESRIMPQIFRIKLFNNSIRVKQVLNDYRIHAVHGSKCVHSWKTAIQSKSHWDKF